MEDELEALIKLDKQEKIAWSAERRERRERRAMKLTVEPEDEDFNLPLYEEVVDQHEQGCNFDRRGGGRSVTTLHRTQRKTMLGHC